MAQCKLLEPIVLVEVAVPFGLEMEIVADLDTRRVERHLGVEIRRRAKVVRALVPLANMLGYANSLRMMTLGRGRSATRGRNPEGAPPSGRR